MIRYIFFIGLMFLSFSLLGEELKVTADKNNVLKDEYLTLTLQLINSDHRLRAEGIDPNVDLTLLSTDFDVSPPKTSFRYRKERTHGRATSELSIMLFPKRVGSLKIPSFHINGLVSKPITIHVLPKTLSETPEIFSESGLTRQDIWKGETVQLYLDLFHRIPIKSASFGGQLDSEPKAMYLEKFSPKERTEKRHGLHYQVTRTVWAITPRDSKKYTFFSPDVWITTSAGKRLRLPVKQEVLNVKPVSANNLETSLIGRPNISVEQPKTASANELLTWNVIVSSHNHDTSLPNKLTIPPSYNGLSIFHGTVTKTSSILNNQYVSTTTYPLSTIPKKPGSLQLPTIKIPYFDTKSQSLKYSTFSPSPIQIETTKDPSFVEKKTPIFSQNNSQIKNEKNLLIWQGISATLFMLWSITLLFLFRRSQSKKTVMQTRPPSSKESPIKQRLLVLLESYTIEEGLLKWKAQYGRYPLLESVALRVQKMSYGQTADFDSQQLLHDLQQCEQEAVVIKKQIPYKKSLWQETILDAQKKYT